MVADALEPPAGARVVDTVAGRVWLTAGMVYEAIDVARLLTTGEVAEAWLRERRVAAG